MQVKTELQPLFSYSIIILCIFVILFCCSIMLLLLYINKQKRKNIKEEIIIPKTKDFNLIKNKYIRLLDKLASNNNLTSRKKYQSLSKLIRDFVYEATNIKVQYYTLNDIKQINMPVLYELISEYYNPEFSVLSKGDINNSINKAKAVIQRWK